ncbi:MAG: SDR family NAD(P)-dependent oxidoreductase [Thermoanaerobaculum sp.]|nr:SDR family NAD(P)-dependent oxidoreductase [Thermoanaerobaculum sp.]MDW7967019.1 SDR family NAD(P)-dependent oxidoreductase [Thermoanaerobaculum sp.]
MERRGRVRVFITGGSSGIGAALGQAFAARGARVVLTARHRGRLEEVREAIRRQGGWVEVVEGDVTQDNSLVAAVREACRLLGGLDVVVANAGFGVVGKVEDLALEDFRRQFETNVFGVLRTVKATLPALRESRGVLVIMGSVSSYLTVPGAAPYAMSKFAVRALAESLRGELAPYGISVVLLTPGFVASNIRRVDNRGVLHPDAPDPVPGWLVMPAERAARKMVRAILRRKAELVVTCHGQLAVWLARHLPHFVRFLAMRLRARSSPQ